MDIPKFKKELTVVILCGGKGLRLRPLTKELPKPLIKINDKSILENIIKHFLNYKIKNFIIATGYKSVLIDNFIKNKFKKHNIKTLYTGINSDIIIRLKKSSEYSKKYFLVCYGDTMLDINLDKYISFYLNNMRKISVASYQLKSSFGILDIIKNDDVVNFKEKPILDIWFNVGYFIFSSDKFHYFKKFNQFQKLLVFLSKKRLMKTYKHTGKHITINTVSELEIAKQQIKKFN
jgi:glucose-1-phosphate cytidylyltransferase